MSAIPPRHFPRDADPSTAAIDYTTIVTGARASVKGEARIIEPGFDVAARIAGYPWRIAGYPWRIDFPSGVRMRSDALAA